MREPAMPQGRPSSAALLPLLLATALVLPGALGNAPYAGVPPGLDTAEQYLNGKENYYFDWLYRWHGSVPREVHNKWNQGAYINIGAAGPITFPLNDTEVTWTPDEGSTLGAPLLSRAAGSPADVITLVGQGPNAGTQNRSSAISAPIAMFQTARMATNQTDGRSTFSVPVNSSGYHFVRLYFPAFVYGGGAVAPFNVYIEGAQVLANFQPGASLGATEAEFFVPVTDGQVDIQLQAGASGVPVISGVSVLRAPPGMYGLTGSDNVVLATEYRVGGGIKIPLRDEIGRIWYHDRPYGRPNDLPVWEYDFSYDAIDYPRETYDAYANTLPELVPYIAYMGGRKARNQYLLENSSTFYENPAVIYSMPVVPSTSYRLRLGFPSHLSNIEGYVQLNVFVDGKPIVTYLDLHVMDPKCTKPYILDVPVRTSSTGMMNITVNCSENSTTPYQDSFVGWVELFREIQVPPPSEAPPASEASVSAQSQASSEQGSSQLWEGFGIGLAVGVVAMGAAAALGLCCLYQRMAGAVAAAEAHGPSKAQGKLEGGEWVQVVPHKNFEHGASAGTLGSASFFNAGALQKIQEGKAGADTMLHSAAPRTGLYGARVFALEELQGATHNFSRQAVLGEGGFGRVYRATLGDGFEVAVKRLALGSQQGVREFMTEVQLLSRLHHKHLVNLIGYCDEDRQLMLVYEYAARGTLKDYLRDGQKVQHLTWEKRLRIAAGAARGIEYLHYGASPPVIHRDIKTSNILLDANFNAKVADFGLSKLGKNALQEETANPGHISTRVKGTLGYLDPVYYTKQQLTEKSDVYSFGVVLLELITGRLPIWMEGDSGPHYQEAGESLVNLVEWAQPFLNEANVGPIVAPTIDAHKHKESLQRTAALAALCVSTLPKNRPNMAEVVRALAEAKALLGTADSSGAGDSEIPFGPHGDDTLECSIDLSPVPGHSILSGDGADKNAGSFSISVVPVDDK